jgi:hypothetical protein
LRQLRRNHREKEGPVAKETFFTRPMRIINTYLRSSKNLALVDTAMRTPRIFRQKIAAICISNSTNSLSISNSTNSLSISNSTNSRSISNSTNSRSVNPSSTGRFFRLGVL